ncbi:MAG TPA: glycoside hydrolase family 30 beta sandwich domain-containing protein [Chitinophagaceae bacterium]|nr:glycoside hydrolase family 30 beta sandwich domain-containing protein [Chitinophagaceae bacterium]
MIKNKVFPGIILLMMIPFSCSRKMLSERNVAAQPATTKNIEFWLTKSDQSTLLQKQPALSFGMAANSDATINVDTAQTFQTIDGFGYSLTGGSAYVINRLSLPARINLLKELFGNDSNSISISYLRISIGASDLNASVFSYDDMPAGQADVNLDHFSLNPDKADVIPLLKEILDINPAIKILGSPWSPPVWMKDNGNSKGGSLLPQYYDTYAKYFVKYIQQMKTEGITIDAITPQNEPLHPGNNPSMLMIAEQERDFIKNNLGPAFQVAGINTKIITYDHNCDRPDYPLTILNDAAARAFVNGSAFHLYGGDISALSQVHDAYPGKAVYFTEQWTGSKEAFEGNLKWHVKNVIIGSMRNWSRIALEWNLASDQNYNPHTPGGCDECKGALTINASVSRMVSYYIVAHASKFVPPGSARIGSNITGNLYNVAFKTPAGKKVLIVENDGTTSADFNIAFNGKSVTTTLPGGGVGTYVW